MRFILCAAHLVASRVQAQASPIPDGGTLERIAEGFQFTEGPLWVHGALLISDIPANTVYRWAPGEATTVFRSPSQKSSGLALRGLSAGRYIVRLRTQNAAISRPLTIP